MDLWMQSIGEEGKRAGEHQRITTGIGMQKAVFSPDGSKLIYSRGGRQYNIWRVPLLSDRPATWNDARQLTFEQAYIQYLDVSPDGQWLLFSSDRSGNQDLWMIPAGGGEIQQITTDTTPDWCPRWSPDGRRIAFFSYRSGNRDIWTMPVDGGPTRQLTDHEAMDVHPDWSPDGQRIAFNSDRSGSFDLWVVPAEGGEARQLTVHSAADGFSTWSTDENWVYFHSSRTRDNHLWRVPAVGGEPEQVTKGPPSTFPRMSLDGERVFFWRQGSIWAISVENGTEHQVTDLQGRPGNISWGYATDGNHLYFTWGRTLLDLWAMDVVRE